MLTRKRLLTPGPTMLPERVRLAMAHDMIHHRKPEFKALLARIQSGLEILFGTSQPVLPLTCSGSGSMAAAITNLFNPGEKVIVLEGGKFAQRWTAICKTYQVEPVIVPVAWNCAADPHILQTALEANPDAQGVLVQLSETSTGVMHPIQEIATVTQKKNVLLVVDGISGVSITPCPMDAWGIDCLITGSQKGLMLPPGLSFIALSQKAWEKAAHVTGRDFYFNLQKELASFYKGETNFTPAISLLVGLDESLRIFQEAGFHEIYRKQWALTMMVRTGITALGLELFVKDHFAWGLTSVLLPPGMSASEILHHCADSYGVVMAAGQDHLKESIIRIGHMGWVDFGDIAAALYALANSYKACGGHLGCRNYLEQALDAYFEAYEDGIPPSRQV